MAGVEAVLGFVSRSATQRERKREREGEGGREYDKKEASVVEYRIQGRD